MFGSMGDIDTTRAHGREASDGSGSGDGCDPGPDQCRPRDQKGDTLERASAGRTSEGRVRDDSERGFPPPDDPIMVYCMHCGKEYMSSEMIPPSGGKQRRAARTPEMMEGIWWCATPGCNAGGFGLDVFPVDPEWKDPKGLLEIIPDSDDDEFEWDDEDEP
jgi:hypothetical protein